MKNNPTFLAAALLVVLALLYFFTQTGSVDTKSINTDALSIDKALISSIELSSSGKVLFFERSNHKWVLENYPVDTMRMNQLVDIFSDLKTDRLITKNSEKHGKYELTDQGSRFLAKSEAGNDLLNLLIGQPGANYQETFVREDGDDQVFAVKASLSQYLAKAQSDFWDRTITQVDVSKINHVEMNGGFNYRLTREMTGWTFNGEPVDFNKVLNMLTPLANLKASNFASEITLENEFYQSIQIGLEDGELLELNTYLKDANGALLLVTISGNDKVFEYSKSGLNRLDQELSDLIAEPSKE